MKAFTAILLAAAALTLTSVPAAAGEFRALNMTVAHSWSGLAPCLAPARRTEASIAPQLDAAVSGAVRINAEVAGFSFRGEPEPLIEAFRQITRLLPSAKTSAVESDCQTVDCAARALFGEDVGPRLLLLAVAYRYNASAAGADAARPWTAAELDELLAAFGDLPPSLFPLRDIDYRALVHRTSPEVATHGRAFELAAQAGEGSDGIVFAQGWLKTSATERRAIIVHEMAHEFTRARGRDFKWRAPWATAMASDARNAEVSRQPSMASAYALKNMDEDFAESVTAYRYMAPLLKRRAPARYAFLKEWMFDGLEYGAAAKCAPTLARSEMVLADAMRRLPVIERDSREQAAIAKACKGKRSAGLEAVGACIATLFFRQAYRDSWNLRVASNYQASEDALNARVASQAFVKKALASMPRPTEWADASAAMGLDR
jgi:hypothetical protein